MPNDFVYTTTRNGKQVKVDKEEIESTKVSFREKLNGVIPQWIGQPDFWVTYQIEKVAIEELY